LTDTLGHAEFADLSLFGAKQADWKNIDSVLILACGTSYYAASTAKYWIEDIAGISTQVEIASEYRVPKNSAESSLFGRGGFSIRRNS